MGGVIASRRNVLLFKPTDKELDKCKFSGVKLHKAAAMVPKLGKLVQTFSAHCKASNLEVILYGELVQKGTASSTEDKYGYRSRGYEEGGYYIFGLGLSGLKLDEAKEIENALKNLKEKGFSCVVKVSDNTCDMVLLMNKELDKCKFSGVKLHKAAAMVPKLGKLVQTFSAHCKASNLEVILYGELVQKGTATSTE